MRLSSRKVGTQQDLKTSSGLKQKHPFSRVWNSSQSPTCFQPLHVFVYSHHGEETFFCSQRHIAKRGHATQLRSKPIQPIFNSIHCGVCPDVHGRVFFSTWWTAWEAPQTSTRAEARRDSQTLPPRVSISETQLILAIVLILHNNIGLVNHKHQHDPDHVKRTAWGYYW